MDDERLIEEVRKHNILYDKTAFGFRNAIQKSRIWNEISVKLGVTDDDCLRRWKCLRDRFTKESKRKNLPSGSGSELHSMWPLFEPMSFLAAHTLVRKGRNNFDLEDEDASENETLSLEENGPANTEPVLQGTPSSSQQEECAAKKKKLNDLSVLNRGFTKAVDAFSVACHSKPAPTKTDEEKFATSLAYFMNLLSDKKKKQAKAEILKYISELLVDELNE